MPESVYDTTEVDGLLAQIPQGLPGKDGAPGLPGKDGAPGVPGKDGLPGKDGAPGVLPADWQTLKDRVTALEAIVKPPPPPPPPPPSTGTPYITKLSDIETLFWNTAGGGPVVSNSSFHTYAAPSGPGFEFVCTDANQPPWNASNKAVLARKSNVAPLGSTQDYRWDMFLPSQTINVSQYVLWQWHTDTSSGHNIAINDDKTYRITRQSAIGEVYDRNYSGGVPIRFDVWTPIRFQIKWSTGSDGFLRVWIDGVQVKNFSGATVFANDGDRNLQFGWYGRSPSNTTNTVRFANIRRDVS